jgi:adenine-specific DNA glycosylase
MDKYRNNISLNMNLARKTSSPQASISGNSGDSRVTSIDLDWSTSAVLSRVHEGAPSGQEIITQVLLGQKYGEVVAKLLDTGRVTELKTLEFSLNKALHAVMERNTEFASFQTQESGTTSEQMSKHEAARAAGKVALNRYLNKESLRKLYDTPLEAWSSNDIRYARTLISFSVVAKYGQLGAFHALDQKKLLETMVKLFKHPKVNKYQELLYEAERQQMIQESQAKKNKLQPPDDISMHVTVRELLVLTRNAIALKLRNLFVGNPQPAKRSIRAK